MSVTDASREPGPHTELGHVRTVYDHDPSGVVDADLSQAVSTSDGSVGSCRPSRAVTVHVHEYFFSPLTLPCLFVVCLLLSPRVG
jgi:hypothetical protein